MAEPPSHDQHDHDRDHQQGSGDGLGSQLHRAARLTFRPLGWAARHALPRKKPIPRRRRVHPGEQPGISADQLAQMPPAAEPVRVSCIDYGPEQVRREEITDLAAFLDQPRPDWSVVRWINVDGLDDSRTIQSLATAYQLHPLAVEDVLHIHQRPKVELYNGNNHSTQPRLFIVARMLRLIDSRLDSEQISIFLGSHTLITLQERRGDVWGPIRDRLEHADSRLRQNDASFLLYALLDAAVDHCFPTLESYSNQLEALDEPVFRAEEQAIHELHAVRHELMLMRREMWPMRDLVNGLQRERYEMISDATRFYLRDVHDHTVQIIDLVETYHEVAMGMADTWMSAVSARMNQVMKVLTIIATIFIPLTFLAGVYGMNFEHMPELYWKWSYPVVWGIFIALAGGMVVWFRRRGWL